MNIVESHAQPVGQITLLSGLTTLFEDTTLGPIGKDSLRPLGLRNAFERAPNGIHLSGFLNQMIPSQFSGWHCSCPFPIKVREA